MSCGGGSKIRTCVALRAADLQSAPIGRSGIPPDITRRTNPAREGIRTPNLAITNRLRYHCATRAPISNLVKNTNRQLKYYTYGERKSQATRSSAAGALAVVNMAHLSPEKETCNQSGCQTPQMRLPGNPGDNIRQRPQHKKQQNHYPERQGKNTPDSHPHHRHHHHQSSG